MYCKKIVTKNNLGSLPSPQIISVLHLVSILAFFQTSAPIGFLQDGRNKFLETKSYAKIKGISAHAKCTLGFAICFSAE